MEEEEEEEEGQADGCRDEPRRCKNAHVTYLDVVLCAKVLCTVTKGGAHSPSTDAY